MSKIGLVVEGGGMKCAYSAGVLDGFIEDNITVDYCIGVSAGSANLCSYTAGQHRRSRRFYTDHIHEPLYFGFKSFLKTGNLFNLQYIYGTLSNEDGNDPIDYDAMMSNPTEFEVVATNALTGEPAYFNKSNFKRNNYLEIMASSAIPAACKPVLIAGTPYFDGGISAAVPVKRAFDKGCDKIICLLSKSRHFIKTPEKNKFFYSLACRKYPNAIKDMDNRHIMYKKCQDEMFAAEKAGKAFIFSLETSMQISTYKMDAAINQKLYELGLSDYHKYKDKLLEFMK